MFVNIKICNFEKNLIHVINHQFHSNKKEPFNDVLKVTNYFAILLYIPATKF